MSPSRLSSIALACLVMSFALLAPPARAQATYDWQAVAFWFFWASPEVDGLDAYASGLQRYLVASFGGPGNATIRMKSRGTCATPPTGPGQFCAFTLHYQVKSSGADSDYRAVMSSYLEQWFAPATDRSGTLLLWHN